MTAGATPRRGAPGAAKLATGANTAVFAEILTDQSPDALIAVAPAGTVLYWNRGAELFFERGCDEAVGRPLPELLAINDISQQSVVRAAMKQAMETGEAHFQLLHERRSGRFSDIAVTVQKTRPGKKVDEFLSVHVTDASILRRLREERMRIRAILESAPDAMVIAGPDGRIEFVNKETERLFCYAPEELLNQPVEILVPQRFHAAHPAHRARYAAAPKTRPMGAGFELYGRRKNGSEFPVEISLSPIKTENGISVVSAIRDVSERKRVERDRNRLAAIVEMSDDAIFTKTLDGVITSWNGGAARLFGYEANEAIGQSVSILIPPEQDEDEHKIIERLRAHEHISHYETRRRRKDGGILNISVSIAPLYDAVGNVTGASAICRDITDRKRAEEKFRSLLESAPDAMVIVDSNGRIVLVNAQTERLFGYRRADLLDQPMEVLVPERYRGRHKGHRTQYFITSKARPMGAQLELYGLRKDGTEFPVEISLGPIHTEEGPLVAGAIRDATERKKAEDALLEAKEAAEVAGREFEAFSYSVAHDLRAPLRGIDGFSLTLLEDYEDRLDENGKKHLCALRQSAQHMARLIDDLLTLARVTQSELRGERVDLSALARAACKRLHNGAATRDVEFVIEDGLMANADGGLLSVVFDNLFDNSWKFTRNRERARIEFGRTRENGETVFFVRDNGAGFDMAYASKLFGVFQRLHSPQEFEGTGIGLVTCQRIIRRHGGRIWAHGEPDKGATFFFTLQDAEDTG